MMKWEKLVDKKFKTLGNITRLFQPIIYKLVASLPHEGILQEYWSLLITCTEFAALENANSRIKNFVTIGKGVLYIKSVI